MKICVAVRTRDEERNIERFCSNYAWADKILIADGGSQDKTKELALEFPNVLVRDFHEQILMQKKMVRNPHGKHLNFLIDWAFAEEDADWIIMDDADCFPNFHLKRHAQRIMEETERSFVYATRLYLYKNEGHFQKMAQPVKKGRWEPGLWAWSRYSGLRFREDTKPEEHQKLTFTPCKQDIVMLMPPHCLLHCPWQDDEMIEEKLNFYRRSGEVKNMLHPLEANKFEVQELPSWAVE